MSTESSQTCPMTRSEVIDAYFMEHRARLIDIAAFLDRLDRTTDGGESQDIRESSFHRAIGILSDGQPQRAARILSLLSDHTTELPQSAEGMKGASGAPVSLVGGANA